MRLTFCLGQGRQQHPREDRDDGDDDEEFDEGETRAVSVTSGFGLGAHGVVEFGGYAKTSTRSVPVER